MWSSSQNWTESHNTVSSTLSEFTLLSDLILVLYTCFTSHFLFIYTTNSVEQRYILPNAPEHVFSLFLMKFILIMSSIFKENIC